MAHWSETTLYERSLRVPCERISTLYLDSIVSPLLLRWDKMCLDVTCQMLFWQNDWRLLRATAVTRGWNGHQKSMVLYHVLINTRPKSALQVLDYSFVPRIYDHGTGVSDESYRLYIYAAYLKTTHPPPPRSQR